MGKNREQWYVVKYKSNKYDTIIFDDLKQCKNFAKSKGVSYKGFVEKEDAIQFAGCKKTKISWRLKPVKPTKICLCCEKPFKYNCHGENCKNCIFSQGQFWHTLYYK